MGESLYSFDLKKLVCLTLIILVLPQVKGLQVLQNWHLKLNRLRTVLGELSSSSQLTEKFVLHLAFKALLYCFAWILK